MTDVADKANEDNEAIATEDAKHDEADKANEIVEAAEADDSDEVIKSDESDDADEVDEADYADEADEADEVDETGVSIEMPLLLEVDEAGVSIVLLLLLPFSLTKYSAIFTEVKESFEIYNNQLGGCLSPLSLMIRFVCRSESVFKNIWSKNCSLRSQCINQLERVVANCG